MAPRLWAVLTGELEPLGSERVHVGRAQDGQRSPCHLGEEHRLRGQEEDTRGALQAREEPFHGQVQPPAVSSPERRLLEGRRVPDANGFRASGLLGTVAGGDRAERGRTRSSWVDAGPAEHGLSFGGCACRAPAQSAIGTETASVGPSHQAGATSRSQ